MRLSGHIAAISLTPGRSEATTGVPAAQASRMAPGSPSRIEGKIIRVRRLQQLGHVVTFPDNHDVTRQLHRPNHVLDAQPRPVTVAPDEQEATSGRRRWSSEKMWTTRSWFLNDDMVPTCTTRVSSAPMSSCRLTEVRSSVRENSLQVETVVDHRAADVAAPIVSPRVTHRALAHRNNGRRMTVQPPACQCPLSAAAKRCRVTVASAPEMRDARRDALLTASLRMYPEK